MSYLTSITVSSLSLAILISCKTKSGETKPPTAATTASASAQGQLALVQTSDLNFSTVSPLSLSQQDFRVDGIRVGLQQYILSSTPILTYQLPFQADYIQILRCPSNSVIYGGEDVLQNLEEYTTAAEENRIFQANNFWQAALSTPNCVLVADSFSDPFFLDGSAPTGSYYYYIRACVDTQRMQKNPYFTPTNCSRQVTSSVVFNFVSTRQQTQLIQFQELASLQAREATLSRQIVDLTQVLGSALIHCQNNRKSAVATASTRTTIVNYASLAGGVAGALAGGVYGAATMPKASPVTTKVTGGVIGGLAGAGAGTLVTFLMGSGLESLFQPLPTTTDQDPACSTDMTQVQIDALMNSYLLESTQGPAVNRPCSCGNANALGFQIQALQLEVTNLQQMITSTLNSMNSGSSATVPTN